MSSAGSRPPHAASVLPAEKPAPTQAGNRPAPYCPACGGEGVLPGLVMGDDVVDEPCPCRTNTEASH